MLTPAQRTGFALHIAVPVLTNNLHIAELEYAIQLIIRHRAMLGEIAAMA